MENSTESGFIDTTRVTGHGLKNKTNKKERRKGRKNGSESQKDRL
jgi:hypothetical protein